MGSRVVNTRTDAVPPAAPPPQAGDGCEYVLVLQEGAAPLDPLPALPPNARFLSHPNKCFDWGTVGWVLRSTDLTAYQYFLWLNPSVSNSCWLGAFCRVALLAAAHACHRLIMFMFMRARPPHPSLQVRGPFLPAWARGRVHWTEPLLSKLTAETKLVGPSINCESPGGLPGRGGTPHIQSYVEATDATGGRQGTC